MKTKVGYNLNYKMNSSRGPITNRGPITKLNPTLRVDVIPSVA